jgi:hypothetical protein
MEKKPTDRILTAWATENSGMHTYCVLIQDVDSNLRVETMRPREWARIKTLVTLYHMSRHMNDSIVGALSFADPDSERDSAIRIHASEK